MSDEVAHDHDQAANLKDWLLGDFVYMAHKFAIEIPVTLSVGGLLIAGMISDGEKYFAAMGNLFSTSTYTAEVPDVAADQVRQDVVQLFQRYATTYVHDVYGDSANHDPLPNQDFNFVHLRAASIYSGGQLLASDRWWRGRLQAIDGFSIGPLDTP